MTEYETFGDDVEVHGKTILTVVDDALARFSEDYRETAYTALAENGIENPESDEWYNQQAWLNTFEVIAEELEPHILDRLGEQIPDVADWPTGIGTVEDGLRSIDDAYQRNHRGEEIGYYRFEAYDDNRGEVVCKTPYPCPFDRGLIRSVTQQYAPIQGFVYIEEHGEHCRRTGDDTCTYTVFW